MDKSLKSLRETVNSKMKSKKEIDEKLAELEKQKQNLELNDRWEKAYSSIESRIERAKDDFENFFKKKERKNKETEEFFKELDSEHFVLEKLDRTHKSKICVYVLKDEFVDEDTRAYDMIRDYKPYDNDQYKDEEVVWEDSGPYKEYRIKFVPFNAVQVPKSVKPLTQEQLDEHYDITVSKDYTGKWSVNGLGYEIGKRHYKTGRVIPKRVLSFFKEDLKSRYRRKFSQALKEKWEKQLIKAGYIEKESYFTIGSSYSSSFKLDNGVKVWVDASFNYEEGTGQLYISRFTVPEPELKTREMSIEEAIEKLESLKVTFD